MATETGNVLDFRDPGAMSEELLSVPGFVNELKNHTLAVAPRPNGLLGRCLFIETDEFRPLGEMSAAKLPQSVVETAKAMVAREKRFNETYVLEPVVVTETPEAKHMLRELRFVTWSCKLADGTEKSGVCDKVFNNTPCTLDFHWPEDIPAEAIGRDIVLTFRLHGGEPNRTPVIRRRTVRLYAA